MSSIGVFDSGIGGLTVLQALRRAIPHRDFLYLGDTARVPYGRKPPEMVLGFAREITAFLVGRGAEAIVVACNTASAVALDELKKEFNIPIWGVIEPGVVAALRATRSGSVGVIGTKATIRSRAYQEKLESAGIRVWAKACPLFVHLVEEDLADSAEAELVARLYLKEIPELDTLILGCTHYPVLRPVLARVLGSGIQLVESAGVAAEWVRDGLGDAKSDARGSAGRLTHFVTGDPVAYEHTGRVIGGLEGEIVALSLAELNAGARMANAAQLSSKAD